MADFDKDDYLRDLPDPDEFDGDAGPSAGGSDGGLRRAGSSARQSSASAWSSASASADGSTGAASASAGATASASGEGAKPAKQDGSAASGESGKGGTGAEPAGGGDDAKSDKDSGATAAGSASARSAADSSDDVLTPLGQAKKEAAEYLEALQRERAEFINFRNRASKEQDRFREHGIIDVLTALLPALDDIDRIREHSEMDDSFKAVSAKIDKAFAKFGVEKFGEKGEEFDPTRHEAVLHRPDEKATKETVDAVVEAGYRIGDRVIRAARVVVASPKS